MTFVQRDLYRAKPAVTRGLDFCGLIQRISQFSRYARQATYSCLAAEL